MPSRRGSLFDAGSAALVEGDVDEAAEPLLIDDIRKLDYLTKLEDQLDGRLGRGDQFTAELLYIMSLPISNMGFRRSESLVETVLSWMQRARRGSGRLVEALDGGVANYGAGLVQRDRYVKYFVELRAGVGAPRSERARSGCSTTRGRSVPSSTSSAGRRSCSARRSCTSSSPTRSSTRSRRATRRGSARPSPALPAVAEAADDDRALVVVRAAGRGGDRAAAEPLRAVVPPDLARARRRPLAGALEWARRRYEASDFDRRSATTSSRSVERMTAATEAV